MTLYAADVDGDGDMDAMSASLNDHKIAWFPNNLPPVLAGAVANQTMDDYSTIVPFAAITVTDRDTGQRLAVSVQLDAAMGSFTAASLAASGFISAGSGNYTFSGTAEAAQEALRLLVFAPTIGRMTIGDSETVRLTITANDAISPTVTNNITTVIVTAIAPPNRAPSFAKGADLEVDEDAPLQNLTGWATNVSAGPPNEASQAVVFLLSNSNTALFTTQPAIDATGTLTFEPTADAWGTATVTVVLKDNGGTADGGADQSAPITFVITVSPVNDPPVVDPPEDITMDANAPAELTLTGLHPGLGEDSQQLTVTASSDAPSLLPNPSVTLHSDGTATMLLAPNPNASGTVTVTIVIRDDGGTARGGHDETVIMFTLTVEQEAALQSVFLPTLFSPNGDGANDALRVRAAGVADIRFSVYSADGHEVFRTTDVTEATEKGWNGRYHDRDMPAGTYTWTLQGHFTDGTPLTFGKHSYGQIVLLR
jgi:gliding motility-associated-like protein